MESFLVRSTRCRTMKTTLTHAAFIRSIVRVDVQMDLECALLTERSATKIAIVLPYVGVRQLMVPEGFRQLERLTALVAVVRSIVAVPVAFVIGQLTLTDERIGAQFALVRFLAQMTAHVDRTLAGAEKTSIARLIQTRISFVAGVQFHVLLQIAKLGHSNAADVAAMRFKKGLFFRGRRIVEASHMLHHFVLSERSIIANVARQAFVVRILLSQIFE